MLNLPTVVRTHLAVHADDAEVERGDGYWAVRTPSNPTFFWGNFLHFEGPPGLADLDRWPALFDARIRARQAASTHEAYSWEGADAGAAADFAGCGHVASASVVMATSQVRVAPPPSIVADLRVLADDLEWGALAEFHIRNREPIFEEHAYRTYMRRRVAHWRARAVSGHGLWVGAFVNDELASALGLYAEERPGVDGLRLARYQDVVTDAAWRRRGLCTALLAHAAGCMPSGAVDRLVIIADEFEAARHIYAARGFEVVGHLRGLQRMSG